MAVTLLPAWALSTAQVPSEEPPAPFAAVARAERIIADPACVPQRAGCAQRALIASNLTTGYCIDDVLPTDERSVDGKPPVHGIVVQLALAAPQTAPSPSPAETTERPVREFNVFVPVSAQRSQRVCLPVAIVLEGKRFEVNAEERYDDHGLRNLSNNFSSSFMRTTRRDTQPAAILVGPDPHFGHVAGALYGVLFGTRGDRLISVQVRTTPPLQPVMLNGKMYAKTDRPLRMKESALDRLTVVRDGTPVRVLSCPIEPGTIPEFRC